MDFKHELELSIDMARINLENMPKDSRQYQEQLGKVWGLKTAWELFMLSSSTSVGNVSDGKK